MTSALRPLALIGVPTSAGSHHAGQEKAPQALRAAGLVEALRHAGAEVEDTGDLAVRRHRPCPPVDGVRDLDRVVGVVREVADRVADSRCSTSRVHWPVSSSAGSKPKSSSASGRSSGVRPVPARAGAPPPSRWVTPMVSSTPEVLVAGVFRSASPST